MGGSDWLGDGNYYPPTLTQRSLYRLQNKMLLGNSFFHQEGKAEAEPVARKATKTLLA